MWRSPRLVDAALITSRSLRRFRERCGDVEASEDSPHFRGFAPTRPEKPVGAFQSGGTKPTLAAWRRLSGRRRGSSSFCGECADVIRSTRSDRRRQIGRERPRLESRRLRGRRFARRRPRQRELAPQRGLGVPLTRRVVFLSPPRPSVRPRRCDRRARLRK
jgi:hypothetical protein